LRLGIVIAESDNVTRRLRGASGHGRDNSRLVDGHNVGASTRDGHGGLIVVTSHDDELVGLIGQFGHGV
jgi:hypothetical protein